MYRACKALGVGKGQVLVLDDPQLQVLHLTVPAQGAGNAAVQRSSGSHPKHATLPSLKSCLATCAGWNAHALGPAAGGAARTGGM